MSRKRVEIKTIRTRAPFSSGLVKGRADSKTLHRGAVVALLDWWAHLRRAELEDVVQPAFFVGAKRTKAASTEFYGAARQVLLDF